MLESGVIDGSLHTMETVVNFRLEDSLKHHTIFPNGFYDATFFVIMNGAKWNGLSDADKAAIQSITGETLSAEWGKKFDAQNPAASARLAENGHEIVQASPELIAAVDKIYDDMVADWVVGQPIYGANDITEHLMALVVFAGLPLVTAAGAHLTIDLADKLVSKPWMAWWRLLIGLGVAGVLGLISWLFIKHGLNASTISEVSQALRVPRAPLYFFMALSAALSAVAAFVIAFSGPMIDPQDTHKEEAL